MNKTEKEILRFRRRRRVEVGTNADHVAQRLTHPGRYAMLMVTGVGLVALGLNFIFLKPAFDPLGVTKTASGVVFLAVGIPKVFVLNRRLPLSVIRTVITIQLWVMLTYAGLQVAAFWKEAQTSLQSPILYVMLSAVELVLLREPYVNPATEKPGGNGH